MTQTIRAAKIASVATLALLAVSAPNLNGITSFINLSMKLKLR